MTKGFTLIELLIVVAIIAILAAIAVPNFLEAQTRSKVSRAKADLRTLATAMETYAVDANAYPPMRSVVTNALANNSDATLIRLTTPIAYVTSLPQDPFASNTAVGVGPGLPGAGTPYQSQYFIYQTFANMEYDYGSAYPSKKAYALTSFGPNKLDDAMGWRMYNWFLYPNDAYFTQQALAGTYDPTNGTISTGDIGRFGGEVPAQSGVVTNTK